MRYLDRLIDSLRASSEAGYCIAQYCREQSGFMRYSWSRGWVFKGFVNAWKRIIVYFGLKKAKRIWEVMMSGEKRIYESGGRAYRIGKDPPYVEKYYVKMKAWGSAFVENDWYSYRGC